ncbi:hypothetical protein WR25_22635 [Diploscapter pachys]|uniref:Uncharacterized protein n=1 Tax=Diploscapter pachys TaxID=2018661 RepID=A0A2A2L6W1_9BILA|nr:hypothetical protein WR25_22635 [Diploscapter pachys]
MLAKKKRTMLTKKTTGRAMYFPAVSARVSPLCLIPAVFSSSSKPIRCSPCSQPSIVSSIVSTSGCHFFVELYVSIACNHRNFGTFACSSMSNPLSDYLFLLHFWCLLVPFALTTTCCHRKGPSSSKSEGSDKNRNAKASDSHISVTISRQSKNGEKAAPKKTFKKIVLRDLSEESGMSISVRPQRDSATVSYDEV